MRRATRSALIAIAAFGVYTTTTAVMSGQQGGPGTRALVNYSTGNIAVPIPDVSTVDVPIVVSDTNPIIDVDASFRINHTFDGDLVISLVHPDGTVIPLVTNRGQGAGGTGANDRRGTQRASTMRRGRRSLAGVAPFAGPA